MAGRAGASVGRLPPLCLRPQPQDHHPALAVSTLPVGAPDAVQPRSALFGMFEAILLDGHLRASISYCFFLAVEIENEDGNGNDQ